MVQADRVLGALFVVLGNYRSFLYHLKTKSDRWYQNGFFIIVGIV